MFQRLQTSSEHPPVRENSGGSDAQAIVAELANRLHAAVAGPSRWAPRASAAEISTALEAWRLARAALSEAGAPSAAGLGLTAGEIRDARDGAATDTCDVAGIRQQAEQELYALVLPSLQSPADELLAALIRSEQEALQRLSTSELASTHHSEALRTLTDDVCRTVRTTSQQLQRLQHAEELRRAGQGALRRVEVAVARWLAYHEVRRRQGGQTAVAAAASAAAGGGAVLPADAAALAPHMATNPALRRYVVALRRCFQLRRQQVRLEACLQRIQVACDALDRLAALRHCFPSLVEDPWAL